MLDYDWGNPSTVMLTGDEQQPQDCNDQSRQFFDSYDQTLSGDGSHHFLSHQTNAAATAYSHHQFHAHSDIHNIYDLESPYPQPPPFAGISTIGGDSNGSYLVIPKNEEIGRQSDYTARIGLNLGHRTYFSSDDDFVNRLYRRSRPGPLDSNSINMPRCQAEGCTADLTNAKHYHRRHKVCEFHSKVSTVIAGGLTQRFCQQCSRFHLLTEFDNGKRSCRKRLADHNRRRRKSQHQPAPQTNQNHQTDPLGKNAGKVASETLTRSSSECGNHSSSSVTVAMSPPRMTLDCFRQKSYNGTISSASSNLLFYANE